MKLRSIVLTAAALLLPGLAGAQSEADQAAAAERTKLVTSVQAKLGVPVDGKMGPETHAAIKEFQQSKKLDASGQLDAKTLTALGMGGPKPSSAAGASTHMQGKPSTPIGPKQSSEVRAAEPLIKPAKPTGD